jgi:hypothetical protein
MAQPTVISGTKLLILVGDGGSPEVFAEPCGLTTKAFDLAATTNTNIIPDCANPDAAAWEATDVNALSGTATGNGVMAAEAYPVWNAWFMSSLGRNCQIKLNAPTLGHYSGSFKLTSLKLSGTRGNKVLVDLSMKSDGAITYTVP